MKRLLLLVTCLALFAGCASMPTMPTPAPGTLGSPSRGTIRVNHSLSLNVTDVPLAVAEEILREKGYTIESVDFDKIELVPPALERGELDIANGGYQVMWPALAKGAAAKTILQRNGNQYVIASSTDLKSCNDLQGKSIALGTARGMLTEMLKEYFAVRCPGVTPELVVVPGSNNRVPALVSGAVPAAQLELDDMIRLEAQEPEGFHPIIAFGKEFPDYGINGYYVSDAFAQSSPEAVRDFIRAILETHRRFRDPEILKQAILKHTELDEASATRAAETYHAQNMFDANGGLTDSSVQNLLTFMISSGTLPEGTSADQVADLHFLNEILEEMGRE
jgi:ABC-type nitrate/sulfonate/bicarbonate transport system substrate-binding protein